MNTKKVINLSLKYPRITVRTLATLAAIGDNEGSSVSEIAQRMEVGEKNVATTIRRLEEGRAGNPDEQLIRVKQDAKDKRFKLIYLTAKGRNILKKL
ncbi:winged helix DNA-binding protein [Endozoicomonas sp. SM1973]|uniref:Winged helix DNA-binding protein n=2 Tax=Spartinivicinus TaxID=2768738 RepID=A0A853IIL4_9GAMM|nr:MULTISPECIES: winged helix DNA-binding protein [Spartinivicinus]MCX4028431.1 winged helix DNA-binding protein [Spartinivicinus marinus]MDE1464843.1 winged helix DNA-binding protein [Spartinivicinus sp. A2-2]NYZ67456.1 winged helix DNA-binding protein [Spartinivicinus marinus]